MIASVLASFLEPVDVCVAYSELYHGAYIPCYAQFTLTNVAKVMEEAVDHDQIKRTYRIKLVNNNIILAMIFTEYDYINNPQYNYYTMYNEDDVERRPLALFVP
jgi:hypothetical protein